MQGNNPADDGSTDSNNFGDLRASLEDDLSKGGYPDWWKPAEAGEELLGRVKTVRHDPFGDGKIVLEVETENGETYSTPTHSILSNLAEEKDVAEGDMVLIEFDGEIQTQSGQMAKDYALGVVKA